MPVDNSPRRTTVFTSVKRCGSHSSKFNPALSRPYSEVAERLRDYRLLRNTNQDDFGVLVGCAKASVSRNESGRIKPRVQHVKNVIDLMKKDGAPVDQMLVMYVATEEAAGDCEDEKSDIGMDVDEHAMSDNEPGQKKLSENKEKERRKQELTKKMCSAVVTGDYVPHFVFHRGEEAEKKHQKESLTLDQVPDETRDAIQVILDDAVTKISDLSTHLINEGERLLARQSFVGKQFRSVPLKLANVLGQIDSLKLRMDPYTLQSKWLTTDNVKTSPWGVKFQWDAKLEHLLRKRFSFDSFRPLQREAINASLSGKDLFVQMPTAAGKSLIYQLPAVYDSKRITIVVSPLKALIYDQVEILDKKKITAVHLKSSDQLPVEQMEQFFTSLIEGTRTVNMLYITPELLADNLKIQERLRQLYDLDKLSRFVIDEAHCISEWGNDFRPAFKRLTMLREEWPQVPISCLTATAPTDVVVDVHQTMHLRECVFFSSPVRRENLRYRVEKKEGRRDYDRIVHVIKTQYADVCGIVYCLSIAETETLSEVLRTHGLSAAFYHAKMTPKDRDEVHQKWRNDTVKIVCATTAFGLGVDKANVRFVIHTSPPYSLCSYYQESGRAGRDGKPSDCILFYSWEDKYKLRFLTRCSTDTETRRAVKDMVISDMFDYCAESVKCRHSHMASTLWSSAVAQDCVDRCDNCKIRYEDVKSVDMTEYVQTCVHLCQQFLKLSPQLPLSTALNIFRGKNVDREFRIATGSASSPTAAGMKPLPSPIDSSTSSSISVSKSPSGSPLLDSIPVPENEDALSANDFRMDIEEFETRPEAELTLTSFSSSTSSSAANRSTVEQKQVAIADKRELSLVHLPQSASKDLVDLLFHLRILERMSHFVAMGANFEEFVSGQNRIYLLQDASRCVSLAKPEPTQASQKKKARRSAAALSDGSDDDDDDEDNTKLLSSISKAPGWLVYKGFYNVPKRQEDRKCIRCRQSKNLVYHPSFKPLPIFLCRGCCAVVKATEVECGEDGLEEHCRACMIKRDDEEMLLCDECDGAYCRHCITTLQGVSEWTRLTSAEEVPYSCLSCLNLIHTVNRILASRRHAKDGSMEYLVEWNGSWGKDQCTWEPASNLNAELIQEFHDELGSRIGDLREKKRKDKNRKDKQLMEETLDLDESVYDPIEIESDRSRAGSELRSPILASKSKQSKPNSQPNSKASNEYEKASSSLKRRRAADDSSSAAVDSQDESLQPSKKRKATQAPVLELVQEVARHMSISKSTRVGTESAEQCDHMKCAACGVSPAKKLSSSGSRFRGRFKSRLGEILDQGWEKHPNFDFLDLYVCRSCHNSVLESFYFDPIADGPGEHCRMCSKLKRKVKKCSSCAAVMCEGCLTRNLPTKQPLSDQWRCFSCAPPEFTLPLALASTRREPIVVRDGDVDDMFEVLDLEPEPTQRPSSGPVRNGNTRTCNNSNTKKKDDPQKDKTILPKDDAKKAKATPSDKTSRNDKTVKKVTSSQSTAPPMPRKESADSSETFQAVAYKDKRIQHKVVDTRKHTVVDADGFIVWEHLVIWEGSKGSVKESWESDRELVQSLPSVAELALTRKAEGKKPLSSSSQSSSQPSSQSSSQSNGSAKKKSAPKSRRSASVVTISSDSQTSEDEENSEGDSEEHSEDGSESYTDEEETVKRPRNGSKRLQKQFVRPSRSRSRTPSLPERRRKSPRVQVSGQVINKSKATSVQQSKPSGSISTSTSDAPPKRKVGRPRKNFPATDKRKSLVAESTEQDDMDSSSNVSHRKQKRVSTESNHESDAAGASQKKKRVSSTTHAAANDNGGSEMKTVYVIDSQDDDVDMQDISNNGPEAPADSGTIRVHFDDPTLDLPAVDKLPASNPFAELPLFQRSGDFRGTLLDLISPNGSSKNRRESRTTSMSNVTADEIVISLGSDENTQVNSQVNDESTSQMEIEKEKEKESAPTPITVDSIPKTVQIDSIWVEDEDHEAAAVSEDNGEPGSDSMATNIRLAPPPPARLSSAVKRWPFEAAYEMDRLLLTNKITWDDVDLVKVQSIASAESGKVARHMVLELVGENPAVRRSLQPNEMQNDRVGGIKTMFGYSAQFVIGYDKNYYSKKHAKVQRDDPWTPRLRIKPEPVKLTHSCRYYREFGSDRFLHIHVPNLDSHSNTSKDTYYGLVRYLLKSRFIFANRKYEPLYGRPVNSTIVFWAREGAGVSKVLSAADVLDWHIPPCPDNLHLKPAKYIKRLELGFSSTAETIVLSPDELSHEPDQVLNGVVMSDGCGLISSTLMEKISQSLNLQDNPSAFQARIGSLKGVWFEMPDIEGVHYRDSQKKYTILKPTPNQLTVEICRISHDTGPAYLNRQFITLFEARGISSDVFLSLQSEAFEDLCSMLKDAEAARRLLFHCEDGKLEMEAKQLLLAEFSLDEPYLRKLLQKITKQRTKAMLEKARIPVRQSRRLLMIADPTGRLPANQCFVQVSSHMKQRIGMIKGPVVAARNPCHHPGDILQLEAVDIPELRHLWDVIVLSTQGHNGPSQQTGDRSPADCMSGGDYDGDTAFVSWDKRLTALAPHEPAIYSPLEAEPEPVPSDPEERLKVLGKFFVKYLGTSHLLGELSNLHEAWADQYGATHENSLELAKRCFFQVDAVSTGHIMAVPQSLRQIEFPHYKKVDSIARYTYGTYTSDAASARRYRTSTSVCGKLFDDLTEKLQNMDEVLGHTPVRRPNELDAELLCPDAEGYISKAQAEFKSYNRDIAAALQQFSSTEERDHAVEDIVKAYRARFANVPDDRKLPLASAYYQVTMSNFKGTNVSKLKEFAWRVAGPWLCSMKANAINKARTGMPALSITQASLAQIRFKK